MLGVCNSLFSHDKETPGSNIILGTDYISNNWHFLSSNTPPPPVNDICTGATDLGIIDCEYSLTGQYYWPDPEATPDPETTGNCISNTEPGQWYTFTTPSSVPYGTLRFDSGGAIEVFSSISDCFSLVYEGCGFGQWALPPQPGITYYVLTNDGLSINGWTSSQYFCDSPSSYSGYPDNPILASSHTSCGASSDVVPCENDHTRWYEYTTGCMESDILIELSEYTGNGTWLTANEVSITAVLDDCTTLMSDYDINGLGYVCSAIGSGEILHLENIPSGFTFLIAYGSDGNNPGFFDVKITETSAPDITNDLCPDAEELFNGVNLDLTNVCSTLTPTTNNDASIQTCGNQQEASATVWYEYDPGDEYQDIIINLISTGINSPAIAVYEGCIGNFIGTICGTTLEFSCIDYPIMIEIGSSQIDAGTYDIEIISSPSLSSDLFFDTCDGAEELSEGLNESFTNKCATLTGPPTDALIQDCASQSAATVWFQYDPGSEPLDLIIDLISTGITTPAIAAYDGCVGGLLGVTCGTTLELICVQSVIFIEIGSSTLNTGSFDLDISSSPSVSSVFPEVTGNDICSGTESDVTINIPNGEFVNIIIEIGAGSSSSIEGVTSQTINGVNSATINDILINNASTDQEAIYTITVLPLGASCPPAPVDFTFVVYPKFNVSEITIDECTPYLLQLNANEVIEGGSFPYSSITWYWNGTNVIGNTDILSYDLQESGLLTLEITDIHGCQESAEIDVIVSLPVLPTFDFPLEYCRSDQDFISFPDNSIESIEGTWNIPSIDITSIADGFYDITFTPNDPSCTLPTTVTIEIFTGDILLFFLPNTICSNETEFIFPTEDLNGVSGTWDIPFIDPSSITGVQFNVFTPTSPGCYAQFEYVYAIEDEIELNFNVPESLCKNAQPFTFDNMSIEGYEGTWDFQTIDPSLIDEDSFTNTWTPLPGQSPCIVIEIITVQITDIISPEFELPDELCASDSIFVFPTSDIQLIEGTWSLDSINLSETNEPIQSTFTPDDNCVESFSWEIEIINPLLPEFTIDTSYCALDTVIILPLVSDNGITGTWSIPTFDPSQYSGEEVSITFQSEASAFCVEAIEVLFEVTAAEDPSFELPERLCWTDQDLLLPTNSDNGIEGEWNPSIINIQANLGAIISSTFTPNDGTCSNEAIQSFEVLSPYDLEAIVTNPSDCVLEDGTIQIDVLQGTNLEFSIDGGMNWQSAALFGSLSSGGYTILVRSEDFTTCELSIDAFLNSTDGPVINNIMSTDIESCVMDNGSITINAEGDNLEYSIDDGATWQTSNEFNNLSAGDYLVSIREGASDCIVEASAMIADFPNTEILNVNLQDISDCNEDDGQIEIIADGEALEYSIDNGLNWSIDNIFDNLSSGMYSVIVQSTEAEDCSETMMVELIAPNQPVIIDLESQHPSLCLPTTGRIEVQAEGSNLEYSIDGGVTWQSGNIFNNLASNEYQFIVRDSERINCFAESLISIIADIDSLAESTLILTPPSECDLADGKLEAINENPNVEYSIDGGDTWQLDNVFSNISSGNYVLITRKVGVPECLVEQAIAVPNIDCPCNDLILELVPSNVLCDEDDSATIELVDIQGMIDPNIDILWQDGTQGQSIEGVGAGWHYVTITYDVHCEWPDSVYIDRSVPIEFDWIVDDLNCLESKDGMIQIVDVTGGNGNYSYSIDGVEYQTENVFTNLAAGIYEVSVLDDNNCFALNNVEVTIQPNLQIELPEIVIITLGESIVLDPGIDLSQIDSFKWTYSDGTVNSTDLILEVSPEIKTSYSLEIFYRGCSDQKEITIEVQREEEEEEENNDEEILVGNIFSPNGDNINDFLYIQGSGNSTLELNGFSIFDRWGNLLHHKIKPEFNNKMDGWNGYFGGKLVNDGVYIYLIDYRRNGEDLVLMGTVTLVRN